MYLSQGVIATSSPVYPKTLSAVRSAILQANPSLTPPPGVAEAAVVEDAVADELSEAQQGEGVEKVDGQVVAEEIKAPVS